MLNLASLVFRRRGGMVLDAKRNEMANTYPDH